MDKKYINVYSMSRGMMDSLYVYWKILASQGIDENEIIDMAVETLNILFSSLLNTYAVLNGIDKEKFNVIVHTTLQEFKKISNTQYDKFNNNDFRDTDE